MNETTTLPAPAGWREALDESEADLAAGRLVAGALVHEALRDSIARMRDPQEPVTETSPPAS